MKKGRIKRNITDAMELPREVVLNLPLITVTGNEEVFVENYKGIIEYNEETVRVNTSCGVLRIEGRNIYIKNMSAENIIVTGTILRLEYLI